MAVFTASVSEPEISVSPEESMALECGVILQCKATCWLPEPNIHFLDDGGNDIAADEPKRLQEASGCYTVRRQASVRSDASRFGFLWFCSWALIRNRCFLVIHKTFQLHS